MVRFISFLFAMSFVWPIAKIDRSVVPWYGHTDMGDMHCTAFSINPNGRYLTAAHCIPLDEKGFINDDTPAVVTEKLDEVDLAVVTASVGAPSLKLGPKPAKGQKLLMYGHINYVGFPLFYEGLYMGDQNIMKGEQAKFMTSAMVPDGMSGGPIVDEKGRVVSMTTCGAMQDVIILTCGVSWPDLKKIIDKYGG